MHTKEIVAKNIANMYSENKVIPLLQGIVVAGANGAVRYLTRSS